MFHYKAQLFVEVRTCRSGCLWAPSVTPNSPYPGCSEDAFSARVAGDGVVAREPVALPCCWRLLLQSDGLHVALA